MKFSCPHCGHDVRAGDAQCSACKKPLDAASLIRRSWKSFRASFKRATKLKCPLCGKLNTAKSDRCAKCGCDFSVAEALVPLLRPLRKKWDVLFTNATPATKRVCRIVYVLVSAILFWLVLGFSEKQGSEWYLHAALSVVYLAVFTLFLVWVVPREYLVRFAKRIKPIEKIGLIFNYFTLLLVLQALIGTWKQRAIMLAVLFGVSWLGFYIFLVYVFPVWTDMGKFFADPDTSFDPRNRQGRNAHRG